MAKLVMIVLIPAFLAVSLTLAGSAFAGGVDLFNEACSSSSSNPACGDASNTPTESPVAKIIRQAAYIISFIVGAAAIVLVILGGFKYVTSAGDPNAASQGKDMIIYALIGIVVTTIAGAIVFFITDRFLA